MTDRPARSRLARRIAEALVEYADELERQSGPPGSEAPELPEGRGSRQRQILTLRGLAEEHGMKTADINEGIGYHDVPNTYNTLQAMQRAGLVERIPGAAPQRWRLTEAYRKTAVLLIRIAGLVGHREITTYGDISKVAFGHARAGLAVGQAASRIRDFPSAHRILDKDLAISPNWRWHDGERGPEFCRELLEEEGIKFDDDGHVLSDFYIDADMLRGRLEKDLVHAS